jgi:hypothetical protein
MKKIIYLFIAASLLFTSCSKDDEPLAPVDQNQETINMLSNTHWKLTKDVQGGVEKDISSIKNHFQGHGHHESGLIGEGHTSYIITVNGDDISASADWTYKVHDDGNKMTITTISNTYNGTIIPSGIVYEMTFIEISSTKHVATFTLNGVLIERTYEVR